jgi:restriction system protein
MEENKMSLWLVRAGRHGEQEETALKEQVVTVGWNRFGDLSGVKSKEALEKLYHETYPDLKKNKATSVISQMWTFLSKIRKKDLVALPLKKQASIAIGRVESEHYEYNVLADNVKHIRRVKWLKTIPRTAFDQDLLYSFGSLRTVCEIKRNDAEKRVTQMLMAETYPKEATPQEEPIAEEESRIEVEQYAQDEIIKYIDQKFKGHALARLIEAILIAQDYVTLSSEPGPDGGVDILAGAGPLGFNNPKLCVQVKSSSSPADVKILREMQGVMSKLRAEQGLLVSWGGFNRNTIKEAKDSYFTTRLWDSADLLEAIFKHYDKFDDETKAELPLKRIWRLVSEE